MGEGPPLTSKETLYSWMVSGYQPERFIKNLISIDGKLNIPFSSDVGGEGNFSLAEHTLRVLAQFDKYFADKDLPGGIDKNFLRFVLAVHDIGKPEAIRRGKKGDQHFYTLKIIVPLMESLRFNADEIRLAKALIEDDTISSYLQVCATGEAIPDQTLKRLLASFFRRVRGLSVDPSSFFALKLIYFQSDAGSYNKDAGGKKDRIDLFIFDPKNGEMRLSPIAGQRIKELKGTLGVE